MLCVPSARHLFGTASLASSALSASAELLVSGYFRRIRDDSCFVLCCVLQFNTVLWSFVVWTGLWFGCTVCVLSVISSVVSSSANYWLISRTASYIRWEVERCSVGCLLHCTLSLVVQCIIVGPVCGFVALFVCLWVCYHVEIVWIDLHQTGFVGEGSDHLQLIKFWPSCTPRKGVCGRVKIFGSTLLQPAHILCISLSTFCIVTVCGVLDTCWHNTSSQWFNRQFPAA